MYVILIIGECGTSIGMNGNGWMSVDKRGWMDETEQMDIDGRKMEVDEH